MNLNIKTNHDVTVSPVGGKTLDPLTEDDVTEYLQGSVQRAFFISKWQLTDLFKLYNSVAIKIVNIENPDEVQFELLPFDDFLRRHLLTDSSNNHYFVIDKVDIKESWTINLFSVKIAKRANSYYIYLSFMDLPSIHIGGGGGGDPTSGVRIPNPPVVPPPNPPQ